MPIQENAFPLARLGSVGLAAFIAMLASVFLLWDLDYKYLWQDEAQTAVLATRMLRYGKPVAYDGKNLITNDVSHPEELPSIFQSSKSIHGGLDHYTRRGDFKPDFTWKWHPWGTFLVCAISLKLLGSNTLAARLPFALAGIGTVLFLYLTARQFGRSRSMAFLAPLFLVLNAYWVLHARQCRYYALSSLFLVLTILAYLRWQKRERWGAALFVTTAWTWFQIDYGTVWPVFGLLFLDAFIAHRKAIWRPIAVGIALAASIAPFVFYYKMWARRADTRGFGGMLAYTLFTTNEYLIPLLALAVCSAWLWWHWKELAEYERRLIAIGCGTIAALCLWVPAVAPDPYLRYTIIAAPIGCLLSAWLLVQLFGKRWEFLSLAALLWILTPVASLPLHPLLPRLPWYTNGVFFRPELAIMSREIFERPADPNRETIEWLRKNTRPEDEILINYEDVPLMFYLPNPIRGGVSAFRVQDDSKSPPSVVIVRRSVPFVYGEVFNQEIQRYQWAPAGVDIPDRIFGNNPDPSAMTQGASGMSILVGKRIVKD